MIRPDLPARFLLHPRTPGALMRTLDPLYMIRCHAVAVAFDARLREYLRALQPLNEKTKHGDG